MSKEGKGKEETIALDFCPHCGQQVDPSATYCKHCGKLVIKVKPSERTSTLDSHVISNQAGEISRKCPGCGSIINSKILEQCPICDAILPKLPEHVKAPPEPKPGFIFTEKKLEPEINFYIKKDVWNLKEGARIVEICVSLRVLMYLLIAFQITIFDLASTIPAIYLIYIGLLPELLYGIYPLVYIRSRDHDFIKLGLLKGRKNFLLAIIIGLVGGVLLLFINLFSGYIIDFMSTLGWDTMNISILLEEQNLILRNLEIGWKLILVLLIILGSISSELLFRGVLHNSFKAKFEDDLYGKTIVILLVALIYSVIEMILSLPYGIFFVLLDFLVFVILGILYEINHNLYNTIIASVFYNLLIVIMIML
ncbi:MAG: zinc-ribbon domain-containing protein [Promethearchaeota archaeon]